MKMKRPNVVHCLFRFVNQQKNTLTIDKQKFGTDSLTENIRHAMPEAMVVQWFRCAYQFYLKYEN